jgi:uncharacterized membrane protein
MIGREVDIFDLSSRDSERFLARRFFHKRLMGILVIMGLVIGILSISYNVQAGAYGVVIQHNTPANGIGNVTPGIDFQFTVDVTNNGTSNPGEDINFTVELDAASIAAGWTVNPSGTTIIPNLQMGDTTTEIITVRAPIGAQPEDIAIINVTVDVIGHAGEVGTKDSLQLQAIVLQVFDVSLSTSDSSDSVAPGDFTIYDIIAKNTGSGYDDFTVTYWAEDPTAASWSVVSPSSFGLDAGENITITLNVSVPVGTDPGIYAIWLNVTSENESSATDSLRTFTQVTQSYGVLIISGSEQSGEALRGTTISYQIDVVNTGSGVDSFVVEKIGSPTSNHQEWATLSENFIENLGPGQTFILTVDIEIPEDTGGDREDHLLIRIYSNNDTAVPPAQAYIWLNTTILPDRDAQLTPHQDLFYREPGDTIVVKLVLTNTGEETDNLTVKDVTPPPYDFWGQMGLPATVTLDAGNSTNMTYTINIDPDVTRTESPIKLNLVVRSAGANDDVVEDINITIHINQTYGVKIYTTQNAQTVNPGEEAVFSGIQVTNDGNDNDSFTFYITGLQSGWTTSPPKRLDNQPPSHHIECPTW